MSLIPRRQFIAAVAVTPLLGVTAVRGQDHKESPRESWQRVTDVFEAMGIAPGSVVADLGAGGGWFTTRLARAVGPDGRVYAVDVNPISLRELRYALPKDLANIDIVRGEENDPRLPAGQLDAVLVVNA
jgi:predicted methyltransferase